MQLVVGPDEFAGRYSHWVNSVEVVPVAASGRGLKLRRNCAQLKSAPVPRMRP